MASPYEALLLEQIAYLKSNSPVLLQSTTLGVNTASVTFNVPTSTYNTLRVAWKARADNAVTFQSMNMRYNGVSSSSYITQDITGSTTTAAAVIVLQSFLQVGTLPGASGTALYFGTGTVSITGASDAVNYITASGTCVNIYNSGSGVAGVYGGLLAQAGPVSSVTLFPNAGNFLAGSVFSIFGEG